MNLDEIPGWSDVVAWFGHAPTFHDAEVESIDLRREPEPSVVRVHAWRTLTELDERGHFRTDRHAIVSFILTTVIRQDLSGWNEQKVLFDLKLSQNNDGYVLTFEPSYGVSGQFVAKGLRIELSPRALA